MISVKLLPSKLVDIGGAAGLSRVVYSQYSRIRYFGKFKVLSIHILLRKYYPERKNNFDLHM